jgi:hypothetical protein
MLLLALTASACQGEGGASPPAGNPGSGETESPAAPPGSYVYDAYGIRATLEPGDGESWTLKISNKTGSSLAKPGIYALDARDGHQIKGTVEGSSQLNNGQSKEFAVTFAEPLDARNTGLVVLLIGAANWGAFRPA